MTPRQQHIFDALKNAYVFVKWTMRETDIDLDSAYYSYLKDANEDKLTTIEELATLFFLGMAKFGEI